MNRYLHFNVDVEALTNEAYEFVTEPTPRRNDLPIVQELNDFNPDVVDLLECMVLDGTEERDDVLALMMAVFAPRATPTE